MFDYDDTKETYRILSIDPGSNQCGFSVLELNLRTGNVIVLYANTIKGVDLLRDVDKRWVECTGERLSRNILYGRVLKKLIDDYKFNIAAIESAFMGKFAAAFKALTEQVTVFKSVLDNNDPTMIVADFSPTHVKANMGVKGSNKDDMTNSLLKRKDVAYVDGLDVNQLDEHSVDAICVGLTGLDDIKLEFNIGVTS